MAELNANAGYFTVNAVDLASKLSKINLQPSAEVVEVTAGNVAHKANQAGLRMTTLSFSLTYTVGSVATYIQLIKPTAEIAVDYGPEGSTTGKPRHTQSFIVKSANFSQDAQKAWVVFEVEAEAAGAPTNDMASGAVW